MIDLTPDQRFQVLMAELEERYGASHKIRERSSQFTLWLSGLALGMAWLLICDGALGLAQRIAVTLLVTVLYTGAIVILGGLHRGAHSNREATIRVERALGMYEKGCYLPDTSLLPEAYSQTKRRWSHDRCTLMVWATCLAFILIALTWSRPLPCGSDDTSPSPSTNIRKNTQNG